MTDPEYHPISDKVYAYQFCTHFGPIPNNKDQVKAHSDSIHEEYLKLSEYHQTLEPRERIILSELMAVSWALFEIIPDDILSHHDFLCRYEHIRRIAIYAVEEVKKVQKC